MAGRSLFGRGAQDHPVPPANDAPPPAGTPGALRRERRALSRIREDRIRDVGGLTLEMVRRSRFRQDLLFEHCREILVLEQRIHELDDALRRASTARRHRSGVRCECGAPLAWAAHFCANCGRPAGDAVVSCARCGSPLPADARFCGTCGTVADDTAHSDHVAASYEQTAHGDEQWQAPSGDDPWER